MTTVICAICHEPDNTEWCALQCGHVFHPGCLSDWTRVNPICSQCRKPARDVRRIYFAAEAEREPSPPPAAGAAASARSELPEDPQEVHQLRQMLFMEAQERDAAWQQVNDSEKMISRLRSNDTDSRREAQRLARELDDCQMALIQRVDESEQLMRLMEQIQKDSQEAMMQLQLVNGRLESSNSQLGRQLRSSEQQVRELKEALQAIQEHDAASTARLQGQADVEIARLKLELSGCRWQLELEQKARQSDAARIGELAEHKEQMTQQMKLLHESYGRLRNSANEEVNKQKALCLEAGMRLRESQVTTQKATDDLKAMQLQYEALKRRLVHAEMEIARLQAAEAALPTDKDLVHGLSQLTAGSQNPDPKLEDNFVDFPVFPMPAAASASVRPQPPVHQPQRFNYTTRGRSVSTTELAYRGAELEASPDATLSGQRGVSDADSSAGEAAAGMFQFKSSLDLSEGVHRESNSPDSPDRTHGKAAKKSKAGKCRQM